MTVTSYGEHAKKAAQALNVLIRDEVLPADERAVDQRCTSATRSAGRTISFGRRATEARALPAHQRLVDADHAQPGLRELARGVFPARAQPQHHHVTILCRRTGRHGATQSGDRSVTSPSCGGTPPANIPILRPRV